MAIKKKKFVAGIGSRKRPDWVGRKFRIYAKVLEQIGFILRSGGAKGADTDWEKGFALEENKEIFKAKDAQPWAYDRVKKCMPVDRSGFDGWSEYVQGLLARNMMQVLGFNGDEPVEFVVCWTPDADYNTSDVGGTGYAIRCAQQEGIPVYNLVYEDQMKAFEELLVELFREWKKNEEGKQTA